MAEIGLNKIEKFYGANHLLKDITFEINTKDRIGLLGKNGIGKTTIFKIIRGKEPYDGGNLFIKKDLIIGYLDQIPSASAENTVNDILKKGFKNIFDLSKEMKKVEDEMIYDHSDKIFEKYHRIQTKYELMGGFEIDEKISKVMTGLNIESNKKNQLFNSLSGGEKTRVSLAGLLLSNPDVLLLDEPTNHLDLHAVEWLEDYLRKHQGSVLIVSHDRYFLDMTANKIIEIENGISYSYKGNYSAYENDKKRLLLEQENLYKKEENELKKLNDSYEKLRRISARNNKFKKRAVSIKNRAEKLEENRVSKPLYEKEWNISITEKKFSGKEIVKSKGLSKSFNEKTVLNNLDFILYRNESAGLIGANGSGKSTFFKILTGEEIPDSGEFKIGNSVNYVYLEQETYFENENLSILEYLGQYFDIGEGEARNIAAKFLFQGQDVFKLIKNLSGGEKKRLKLCILLNEDKNLLLLDEPTNHLDIPSRNALEQALQQFNCTMLFISHDRYFINKFADKTYEMSNGKVIGFDGNYDFYKKAKQKEKENTLQMKSKKVTNYHLEKEEKKRAEKEKKDGEKLEKEIFETEEFIKNIQAEMENITSDYEKLSELQKEREYLDIKLENLYEKWC